MVHNQNSSDHLQYNEIPLTEETREEYMAKLQKWIDDVRSQNENMFKLWYGYVAQMQNQRVLGVSLNFSSTSMLLPPRIQRVTIIRPGLYCYAIPPMWKRFVAEAIDFIILFIIKMLLTVFILESFDLINLENYGLTAFHNKLQDPKLAMQMSMEILILEIMHRVVVCCYETYWLVRQCATPGKKYMGLAVVNVVHVNAVQGQPEGIVVAHPCTPLTVKDAVLRAVLKNICIGLLLPFCFISLFFKFNRTGYDLMTKSLVVEYNPNPPLLQND